MPNPNSLNTTVLLGQTPCLDPQSLFQEAQRQGWQTSHWAGLPNSYLLPRGKGAGRAYVLLFRSDVEALDRTSTELTLSFLCGDTIATFTHLTFLRCDTLYSGQAEDPTANTPCLVELVDCRYLLAMSVINQAFNVRDTLASTNSLSTDTDYFYYAETENSGTPYTWQTLLDAIWLLLPSGVGAGTSPTLPYSPDGLPENFHFRGVSAWDAYHTVLTKLNCTTVYNPFTHTFTLVQLGTEQTSLTTYLLTPDVDVHFQSSNVPLRNLAAEIPETIRVFFRRQDKNYGTEPDMPHDDNWEFNSCYSVDHATGLAEAVTGTVVELWDDLVAQYEFDGTLANSSELSDRAEEVATNYTDTLTESCTWTRKAYRNLHLDGSCLPGSQIEAIRWFDIGHGMFTEFRTRQDEPTLASTPARILTLTPASISPTSPTTSPTASSSLANLSPPDFGNHTFPHYPAHTQLVRILDGDWQFGLNDDSIYYFDAEIIRINPNTGVPETVTTCWAADLSGNARLRTGDYYAGRIGGNYADGFTDTSRPVVYIRSEIKSVFKAVGTFTVLRTDGPLSSNCAWDNIVQPSPTTSLDPVIDGGDDEILVIRRSGVYQVSYIHNRTIDPNFLTLEDDNELHWNITATLTISPSLNYSIGSVFHFDKLYYWRYDGPSPTGSAIFGENELYFFYRDLSLTDTFFLYIAEADLPYELSVALATTFNIQEDNGTDVAIFNTNPNFELCFERVADYEP